MSAATAERGPSKRVRNGAFQYRIVNKKMLGGKQIWITYDDEATGDREVAAIIRQLKAGIMPDSVKRHIEERSRAQPAGTGKLTLGAAIRQYMNENPKVNDSDVNRLTVIRDQYGNVPVSDVNLAWGEALVRSLKEKGRATNTIKHYIASLRRLFKWHEPRTPGLEKSPLALLTEAHANYTEAEVRDADKRGLKPSTHGARDRRLHPDEEAEIRRLLAGGEYDRSNPRRITIFWMAAMECMFDLALETGMRLSEMTTLYVDQVDLGQRTIFLGGRRKDGTWNKTPKNGEFRQIPITTPAMKAIKAYMKHVEDGTRCMDGFKFDGGRMFPFWNGKLNHHGSPDKKSVAFTAQEVSKRFANVFKLAGADDLHFHDLRHEAISRYFERTKLDAIAISRISGHKNLAMLRRYSNLRASSLVDQLW